MHSKTAVALMILVVGPALAQMKPPVDTSPTKPAAAAPAGPTAPTTDPAIAAKEAAAAKVGESWLKLIDTADYGKAWDECSQLFKEKVTRQQWVDGIPKNRVEFGAFQMRKLDGSVYRKSIPGAPEGEYVSLHFTSSFEKNPNAEELVTLMYQDGAWRPLGYLLR
jgi:hypothetical protein